MPSSRYIAFCTAFAVLVIGVALAAPVSLRWIVGPVVLGPGPEGSFDSVAVKDPSIVYHDERWHLFYTARDAENYTLGYVSAESLETLGQATRQPLRQLRSGKSPYAAAPQVFYFQPHQKWYLVFQTTSANYQPVYSTTSDISRPESWTPPAPLIPKTEDAKWIDFWIICDEKKAYLFFTRNQRDVVVMSTSLADFPKGFGDAKTVLSPVHEAVHVYALPGTKPSYIMLFEQQEGDLRYFGLARATALDGPWTVTDPRFAASERLEYRQGKLGESESPLHWTDEVSHGELVRAGYDERLLIPTDIWQFLVQGMPRKQHHGPYPLLPWSLGIIRAEAPHTLE